MLARAPSRRKADERAGVGFARPRFGGDAMEAAGVSDPVEVLPEICASIMQHAVLEARKAAVAEARTEVQKMLRKVMT